eukprot:13082868-Alexandrium_andersonii.AAC.1
MFAARGALRPTLALPLAGLGALAARDPADPAWLAGFGALRSLALAFYVDGRLPFDRHGGVGLR